VRHESLEPGRLQAVVETEALLLVDEGLAAAEQVDRLLERAGFAIGPLALLRRETAVRRRAWQRRYFEASYSDPRYRPSRLIDALAAAELENQSPARLLADRVRAAVPPAAASQLGRVSIAGSGPLAERLREAASGAGIAMADQPVEADVLVLAFEGFLEVRRLELRKALEKARDLPIVAHCAPWTVTEIASTLRGVGGVAGFALSSTAVAPTAPMARVAPMVEVAGGLNSEPRAVGAALALFQRLGWQTELVDDGPGLVVGRLLSVMANEALVQIEASAESPSTVDAAVCAGLAYRFAPLAWADEVGLDYVLQTLRVLQADYGDDRYRPAVSLRRRVQAGWLGRVSGRGLLES
jgi:3-hydroxybutyryl-CoA dehydrogenase